VKRFRHKQWTITTIHGTNRIGYPSIYWNATDGNRRFSQTNTGLKLEFKWGEVDQHEKTFVKIAKFIDEYDSNTKIFLAFMGSGAAYVFFNEREQI
jgi:hypothetical protein